MLSKTSLLALAAVLAQPIIGAQTIAHRGIFHDVTDGSNLPENSISALRRAADFGAPGVEFDVRPSVDGTLMVTHDLISNRATVQDNAKGVMNPIDVALGLQPAPDPKYIIKGHTGFWDGVELKTYGRNGKIIKAVGEQTMSTLEEVLHELAGLNKPNFMLVLDLQDAYSLAAAGAMVKKTGTSSQVYLKFFAKKAINSFAYKLNEKDHKATCLQYAKDQNLAGLNLIPQINDGELTIVGNRAYLEVFHYRFLITEYLSCWFDAQKAFGNSAAIIPIVSASVPYRNNAAHDAGKDALLWASEYGRKRMSIIPNPDAGRARRAGDCAFYTWDSNNVRAREFNPEVQQDKEQFARAFIRSEDYVVVDVMGDLKARTYNGDYGYFTHNLC